MSDMSRFDPTIRVMQGDDGPDLLAQALVDSLSRPAHRMLSMNLAGSFLLTVLTGGTVPLIGLTIRLRHFIAWQQQQLWHLAEWLRLQTGHPDADALQKASLRIRYSPILALATWLFVLAALGACAIHLWRRGFSVGELARFAYFQPVRPEAILFSLSISAAAVSSLLHLVRHQQQVESCLRWFNQLARRQGLSVVRISGLELGFGPMWLAAGVLLAAGGAFWGLAVMLAAGAHRRYINVVSAQVRAALADRLCAVLRQHRPALRVPAPLTAERICARPNCRAFLPGGADYCPRCGMRMIQR